MKRLLYETLHPEIYHGFNRKPPFFEGWYYRLINAAEDRRYAIIPGVFLGPDAHAFIQVLEGHTRRIRLPCLPAGGVPGRPPRFEVRIGKSLFTREGISLDLDRPETLGRLHGQLSFQGGHPGR